VWKQVSHEALKPIPEEFGVITRTIVIKPEQDGQQQRKWYGQKHVGYPYVPKMYKPASVLCGEEGGACGKALEVNFLHPADVHEAGEEDDGQRGSVVLEEGPDVVVEERACPELATGVGDEEDQHGGHDAQVEGFAVAEQGEDLDALLEVDESDVEAEDVAWKAGDVAQPVARVRDGEDPVHYHGPQADPAHEGQVVDSGGLHDVVDGVVEDGNGPCHAHDDERLAGEHGEDDGAEHRSQQHLVDSILRVGAREHVQGEGQGWKNTVGYLGQCHVLAATMCCPGCLRGRRRSV